MALRSGCSGSVFTAQAKFCTSKVHPVRDDPVDNRGDQLGARRSTTRSTVVWFSVTQS